MLPPFGLPLGYEDVRMWGSFLIRILGLYLAFFLSFFLSFSLLYFLELGSPRCFPLMGRPNDPTDAQDHFRSRKRRCRFEAKTIVESYAMAIRRSRGGRVGPTKW